MVIDSGSKGIMYILRTLGVPVYSTDIDNYILFDGEYGSTNLRIINNKPEYFVVIKKGLSKSEVRLTLAHELGHIVLGHLLRGTPANQCELEAKQFASFIMPYIYAPATIGGSNVKTN